MRARKALLFAVALLLLGSVAVGGCRRVKLAETASGAGASNEKQTVQLGAAASLATSVRKGVGTLVLSASDASPTLALDGSFSYPEASWKPTVKYSVEATRGTLLVDQPDVSGFPSVTLGTRGERDMSWIVKLATGVPTDLPLKLGVGDSDVSLAGIDVTTLEVISDVGKTKLDLTGSRTHDLRGSVKSGVGEVDITVPSNVGVKLTGGTEGVGELVAPGFSNSEGGLVNSAWSGPGPKIELDLTRGVGKIRVASTD